MNLAWMVVVGLAIGLMSSMFVRGTRLTGLIQTTLLGVGSYAFADLVGQQMGMDVLARWVSAIVLSLVLLVAYILFANTRFERKALKAE
ncbi:hypothetical protein U6G28_02385 [Actinomycetaceae bacterium MB13-C1-2]|nr:hypothetical protein U6G28_02385 [Actinomycetaceae bacterium MB13-C1-2]